MGLCGRLRRRRGNLGPRLRLRAWKGRLVSRSQKPEAPQLVNPPRVMTELQELNGVIVYVSPDSRRELVKEVFGPLHHLQGLLQLPRPGKITVPRGSLLPQRSSRILNIPPN